MVILTEEVILLLRKVTSMMVSFFLFSFKLNSTRLWCTRKPKNSKGLAEGTGARGSGVAGILYLQGAAGRVLSRPSRVVCVFPPPHFLQCKLPKVEVVIPQAGVKTEWIMYTKS